MSMKKTQRKTKQLKITKYCEKNLNVVRNIFEKYENVNMKGFSKEC